MRCRCGGELERHFPLRSTAEATMLAAGRPRWSKNRRIRKKLHKKWRAETLAPIALYGLYHLTARPSFQCKVCGRVEGLSSAVVRNIFTVEQLPPGALPYYGGYPAPSPSPPSPPKELDPEVARELIARWYANPKPAGWPR